MVPVREPLTYAVVRAEPLASCIRATVFDQFQALIHLTVQNLGIDIILASASPETKDCCKPTHNGFLGRMRGLGEDL